MIRSPIPASAIATVPRERRVLLTQEDVHLGAGFILGFVGGLALGQIVLVLVLLRVLHG